MAAHIVKRSTKSRLMLGGCFAAPAVLIVCAIVVVGLSVRQERLDRALLAAIERNQTGQAIRLLRDGADSNARMADGHSRSAWQILLDLLHGKLRSLSQGSETALAVAVRQNSTEVVQALLARGAKGVNDSAKIMEPYSDPRWVPLLLIAIKNGNAPMATVLLDHGADIALRDGDGLGALSHAAEFLSNGVGYGPSESRHHSMVGYDLVRLLVERGANIHEAKPYDGSLLAMAAANDQPEIVEYLLHKGANVTEAQEALVGAVQSDSLPMVKELLAHGARVRAADANEESLVVCAPSAPMVRYLVRLGANVNGRQKHGKYEGFTCLHHAAAAGNLSLMRCLLSLGANVNASSYGITPLMRAAQYADVATLRLLVLHGARVNARTADGWTALICAAGDGRDENIDFLLQHGADPDARDSDGATALTWAAQDGNDAAVLALLEGGAKVNAVNKKGESALDIATDEDNTDVIRLLKQWGGRSGKRH